MFNCNFDSTPLEANTKFSKDNVPQNQEDKEQMTSIPYAQTIGTLMHNNVNTRPNCFYTINSLAYFLSNLGVTH
jgi:hypothetical protein